jgi:hypothetical protein
MRSRDHQLIALSHVLFRYRLTGELPNIDGKPFDLDLFKSKLFSGTTSDSDLDVNININTLKTESNVTIVENQTIDCDHDDQSKNVSETTPVPNNTVDENNTDTVEDKKVEKELGVGGKLFQYFNKDK